MTVAVTMTTTDLPGLLGAAVLAGLAGSIHCFGMCGGIAGALALRQAASGRRRALVVAGHHVGRVASYVLAGALVGATGAGISSLFEPGVIGPWLRISAGVLIVLLGLRIAFRWNALAVLERIGGRLWARLAPLAGRIAGASGPFSPVALGALWGFLPCGLVYSMLLLAALSGSLTRGALVMLAFGLGTLPSMATSSVLSSTAARWFARPSTRGIAAVLLIGFGIATAAMPVMHLASPGEGPHEHGRLHRQDA